MVNFLVKTAVSSQTYLLTVTSENKKIKEVGKAGVAPQVFVVVLPLTQSAVCPCRQGLGSDELGGLGEGVGGECSEWIQRERDEVTD